MAFLFIGMTGLSTVWSACSPQTVRQDTSVTVERRLAMMGTDLTVTVEAVSRSAALMASERAIRALEETESRLSTWREDTELARFNRTEPGQPVWLSPRLYADLAAARRWWKETDGAFDPGIGALIEAWGLRQGFRVPAPETLQKALSGGGLGNLVLEDRKAVRLRETMKIEEGGFGKGIGLDEALRVMAGSGVTNGKIDLGGQVIVMGGKPTPISVAHPDRRDEPVIEIVIDQGSVATSGNSERGIVIDGVRYGHILDPKTGSPTHDFGSLTVWAPDATTADCLSTGLYVLGPDGALAWAAGRTNIEVLVLERTATGLRARATPGWKPRMARVAKNVVIAFGS